MGNVEINSGGSYIQIRMRKGNWGSERGRSWTKATQLGLHVPLLGALHRQDRGQSWGRLGVTGGEGWVAEEEFPKTISFLSKVRIPAWGGGGRDPSLREPSGPARPSEGRGGGRGAARAP